MFMKEAVLPSAAKYLEDQLQELAKLERGKWSEKDLQRLRDNASHYTVALGLRSTVLSGMKNQGKFGDDYMQRLNDLKAMQERTAPISKRDGEGFSSDKIALTAIRILSEYRALLAASHLENLGHGENELPPQQVERIQARLRRERETGLIPTTNAVELGHDWDTIAETVTLGHDPWSQENLDAESNFFRVRIEQSKRSGKLSHVLGDDIDHALEQATAEMRKRFVAHAQQDRESFANNNRSLISYIGFLRESHQTVINLEESEAYLQKNLTLLRGLKGLQGEPLHQYITNVIEPEIKAVDATIAQRMESMPQGTRPAHFKATHSALILYADSLEKIYKDAQNMFPKLTPVVTEPQAVMPATAPSGHFAPVTPLSPPHRPIPVLRDEVKTVAAIRMAAMEKTLSDYGDNKAGKITMSPEQESLLTRLTNHALRLTGQELTDFEQKDLFPFRDALHKQLAQSLHNKLPAPDTLSGHELTAYHMTDGGTLEKTHYFLSRVDAICKWAAVRHTPPSTEATSSRLARTQDDHHVDSGDVSSLSFLDEPDDDLPLSKPATLRQRAMSWLNRGTEKLRDAMQTVRTALTPQRLIGGAVAVAAVAGIATAMVKDGDSVQAPQAATSKPKISNRLVDLHSNIIKLSALQKQMGEAPAPLAESSVATATPAAQPSPPPPAEPLATNIAKAPAAKVNFAQAAAPQDYAKPAVKIAKVTVSGFAMTFDAQTHKNVCDYMEKQGHSTWVCGGAPSLAPNA